MVVSVCEGSGDKLDTGRSQKKHREVKACKRFRSKPESEKRERITVDFCDKGRNERIYARGSPQGLVPVPIQGRKASRAFPVSRTGVGGQGKDRYERGKDTVQEVLNGVCSAHECSKLACPCFHGSEKG